MKKLLLLFILIFPAAGYSQDVFSTDEDAMFQDQDIVVEQDKLKESESDIMKEKKSVGISGEILSVFPYTVSRDSVYDDGLGSNSFEPYMFGNLQLDARLTGNYKGFANTDVEYSPEDSETDYYMRELFVDFNFAKAVYFRAGKQVLKWGRCYLWNPTDVINIQKTTFLEQIRSREGTYGLKVSVPFGTVVNMYGFADMYHTNDADEVGGAYKLEFLIGNTEMAFSAWGKKGYYPVYGYDFSTRLLSWDVVGEASVSEGSNSRRIRVVNNTIETYQEKDKWITKAAIGIGRSFDGLDIPDRYSLRFEFFYNGAGYSDNILEDTNIYAYDEPVSIPDPDDPDNMIEVPFGTKEIYLLGNELYEPNYLSRYYAAVFTSVNRLFISELTFNLNGIVNITDHSYIVSAGLSYQNINDFKAGITVNAYFGDENSEYTLANNAGYIRATAGILF
jgi:hypothetical protein